MCRFIETLVGPIIGGIISAGVGYWMFCLERNRAAKDVFHDIVSGERAKLETMKLREAEFFEQSIPIMSQAVYRVQRFVTPQERTRLHQVLRDYQSHHKSEFEGGLTSMAASAAADLGTGKTHVQILEEFIDKLDECVR